MVVLLMILYYIIFANFSISGMLVSIIGFTLTFGASVYGLLQLGVSAIDVGQYEAASVLGYSKSQTFLKIICPQMIKIVIPSVTNEVITLIKDTSLAFVVAYAEMFTMAKQVAAAETTVVPLFVAGAFYYIFNYIVAFISERIEKSLNYY